MLMKYDPSLYINNAQPLPVFRINSWGWRFACPDQPARDYLQLLRHKFAKMRSSGPIVVMVHGAGFSPFSSRSNAQDTLYGGSERSHKWSERNWPARFSATNDGSESTLGITYGWHAIDSAVFSKPNHRALFDMANAESTSFALFINSLKQVSEGREIYVMAHGLGARVVLQSLEHVTADAISRVVLADAHEFNTNALTALATSGAKGTEFYNLQSRKLAGSDHRANSEYPKSGPKDQLLALGFMFKRANWVDFDTSSSEQRPLLLRGAGFEPSEAKICRWSFAGDSAVDDLITRIINKAPYTDVNDLKNRLGERSAQTQEPQGRAVSQILKRLSPLRRRVAL